MTQNNDILIHKCLFCNYQTIRKYDLKRHHNNKHLIKLLENNVLENNGQNVIPKRKNVIPKRKNVIPNEKNVIPNRKNVIYNQKNKEISNTEKYICKKCDKIYKIKKSYIEHEKTCKGIDELTCPKCMVTFTNRHNKSRHIIKNNCKPRSIIYSKNYINKINGSLDLGTNNGSVVAGIATANGSIQIQTVDSA